LDAMMPALPELPSGAFGKADQTPDPLFYDTPRFVAHIDDAAIAAVTALYREVLPEGGVGPGPHVFLDQPPAHRRRLCGG
jgi:hypothetical protein